MVLLTIGNAAIDAKQCRSVDAAATLYDTTARGFVRQGLPVPGGIVHDESGRILARLTWAGYTIQTKGAP